MVRALHLSLTLALVAGLSLSIIACGDDGGSKDCTSLCKEAQARSCTTVKGDCAAFCAAAAAVAPAANCASQREVYLNCLGAAAHPCDSSCGAQEQALVTCATPYCLLNPTNKDCQTLVASF